MAKMINDVKTLPLFQIRTPRMEAGGDETEANRNKKRNKAPEAQVHKIPAEKGANKGDIKIHKTFGTGVSFHKIKKHENDHETETIRKPKIKRKYLMKENNRLSLELIKLTEQMELVREVLQKKDTKIASLKEKLHSVQNVNELINEENNQTKIQYTELLQKSHNCLQCEELKEMIRRTSLENDTVQKLYKEQNEDVNMLKNVVYRLNVQLERYQEKQRKCKCTTTNTTSPTNLPITINEINTQIEHFEGHNDHPHSPISWGTVNVHTLGPLLDAYQNTVKEKEDIIQKYELELSKFTGKLKLVSDENEALYKKNMEDSALLKSTLEEFESMKLELGNTKEQNQLLVKKCGLKHDKLQEVFKIYEHKIASMRRDFEVLQDQHHRTRAEFSGVTMKHQSLIETYEALKADKQTYIPLTVHTSSVNECKRLFEELKNQYETEKTKLLNELNQLSVKVPNMEKQIIDLAADKQGLEVQTKTSEKQLKKLEQKLKEVQATLSHVQVSRDSCKRQLEKAIEFGKDLIREQESLLKQLSTRSKESKAAIKYGNSIISQMDSLKTQLKSVQKDAYQGLATVEQCLTEKDLSIESMRKEHELEINQLIKEIRSKDDIIATLIDENAPAQPYMLYRDKIFSNTC